MLEAHLTFHMRVGLKTEQDDNNKRGIAAWSKPIIFKLSVFVRSSDALCRRHGVTLWSRGAPYSAFLALLHGRSRTRSALSAVLPLRSCSAVRLCLHPSAWRIARQEQIPAVESQVITVRKVFSANPRYLLGSYSDGKSTVYNRKEDSTD